MMFLTSSTNFWRLGALLAGIICMLCHTAASAEVSKAEEEVWEAWKSHVAQFHNGDEEFLSSPDRFGTFRKSFELVKSHNERYAAGKETFSMKLSDQAAFVTDYNPQPRQAPAPQEYTQSSPQFDGRGRMLVLQKPRCGRVFKKNKTVSIRMCPKGLCCTADGRCGRGNVSCGPGCLPQFGRCENSTFFSTGIPPFKDPEPEGVFIRSIVQETKFRYASISPDCLPPCVDWRPLFDKVRNQFDCGNCWAVSSTAAIEATLRITTGKFANLSVQQPMDCSDGTDIPSAGCQGGWPEKNLEWITTQKGMALEDTYPTVYLNQTCQSFQTVDVNVISYGYVPSMSVAALKAAVSVQPIVVYIKAEPSLELYEEGTIYSPRKCGNQVNHAVLLVGYCIDWSSGKGYWIIQNSWGKAWGEGGYVRVAMTEEGKEGICGMLVREPVFPVVRGPRWDPCFFRPCGGGTCEPSSSLPGGFTCTSCPQGFYVQRNSDGTQTCAVNPCEDPDISVCGSGDCKFAPNENYGYTCQCEEGTVLGAFTSGAPTCSLTSDGVRSYRLKAGDTCEKLAKRNSFTLEAFQGINPNLDCSNLIPEQLVSLGNFVPNPKCTSIYTVVKGDTCETIRKEFKLSLDDLDALNPGIDCKTALPTYWQLCVEGKKPPTQLGRVPRCGGQLKTGDTDTCLRMLAKSGNKVSVEDFIRLNGHILDIKMRCQTKGMNLPPNKEVCVKKQTISLSSRCQHSIQSAIGDTCLTISIRERLSVADLKEKNPGLNCDLLQIGRILCVR